MQHENPEEQLAATDIAHMLQLRGSCGRGPAARSERPMMRSFLFLMPFVMAVFMANIAPAGAQGQSAATVIEARKEAMKAKGGAMRVLTPLARGDSPWNQDAALAARATLRRVGDGTAALFPRGTGPESGVATAALPAVWDQWSNFEAATRGFTDAARVVEEAAKAGDLERFKGGFGALARSCGTCHETFRARR